MDRRKFIRIMGLAGAAAALPWGFDLKKFRFQIPRAYAFSQSPTIPKFVYALPGLGTGGANALGQYIPVATPTTQTFMGLTTDVYNLTVKEFTETIHPALTNPTTFRGYWDNLTPLGQFQQYLGPVVVAQRDRPVLFNITNGLVNNTNLVPVDDTLMATTTQTVGQLGLYNRIANHLHGGFTPWFSDGTPFQWFAPGGQVGESFLNVPGTSPPAGTGTFYYPNQQSARLMWYHDHAMGITRTNAYLGIASGYLLTDAFETNLIAQGLLPDLGIPMIIQEKSFVSANIGTQDPTWTWGGTGSLWYPHVYEPPPSPDFSLPPPYGGPPNPTGRWDNVTASVAPFPPISALIDPSCVPEAFLDTPMVNGAPYPFLNVTDKRVRFRILNASQARFWHLNLYVESTSTPGEADLTKPGPALWQLGTEGGWLPEPVKHPNGIPIPLMPGGAYPVNSADPSGGATGFNLLLAPAERADIIIDFKGWAGANLILYNDAPSPFPNGDARYDYFTGDLDLSPYGGAPATAAGFGPNTRTIMKFVVGAGPQDTMSTGTVMYNLSTLLKEGFLNGEQPGLLYHPPGDPSTPGTIPYTGVVNRRVTLNEDFDAYGRLIQRGGTTQNAGLTTMDGLTINGVNNQGLPTWGRSYVDSATETPAKGAVEVWEIYNLTGDVHPWHFHLVNVQIIQRAIFDVVTPTFSPIPGTERPPDPNELGWKETVRINPGELITVIAKFDLPQLPVAMGNPLSQRTGGHEYVHHCHILEHEEHDMMRPLVVGKGDITPAISLILDLL